MKNLVFIVSIFLCFQINAQINTLQESIYFGLGKSSLTSSHKKKLDSVVTIILASKVYTGEIKGYTCTLGSNKINQVISNLRALNVLNYLVDKGVVREYFTYSGLSTQNPKGDNSTSEGRALNRRTDIEIILSLFDNENIIADSEESSQNIETVTGAPGSVPGYTGTKIIRYQPSGKTTGSQSGTIKTNDPNITSSIKTAPPIELGPDFVEGKIPKAGSKLIKSTNGITIGVDKNSLVSGSEEPINLDFRDYSKNFDIIKKGIATNSYGDNLKMLGAFNIDFNQEYETLTINSQKPVLVSIPAEYDPEIKVYSNHRNWTLDTLNKLSYNNETKSYEISVINNSQMIGLLKPVTDTMYYLAVKIKGVNTDLLKPYVVYDDCTISNGKYFKGSWFTFPITKISNVYKLRGQVIDYSTKNATYKNLNFDIVNLQPIGSPKKLNNKDIIYLKCPSKIMMNEGKLPVSSLCEDSQTEISNDNK